MLFNSLKRSTLIIILLTQLVLGAVLEKQYGDEYCPYYVKVLSSGDQTSPIAGWWKGNRDGAGMTDKEMGDLAREGYNDSWYVATEEGRSALPSGATVYVNGNLDVVIAAIGGGTGDHGEVNVQEVCRQMGIEFSGGKIVTYWSGANEGLGGYIPACKPGDLTYGPDRNNDRGCLDLLRNNDIRDKKGSVERVIGIPKAP